MNNENIGIPPEEPPEFRQLRHLQRLRANELIYERIEDDTIKTFPEVKVVVAKILPHLHTTVNNGQPPDPSSRPRPRRHHHRKHTSTDHT